MNKEQHNIPEIAGFVVAREGSKSIPKKNLQIAGGLPLVAHTFKAAVASGMLNRVILSTDDREIIALAPDYGVDAPFARPSELAGDNVHVIEATVHALTWLAEHENYKPEYFMLLQPTSPLRNARDIRAAVSIALRNDADAVVSVTPSKHHPNLSKVIDKQGRMRPFVESGLSESRRQDLPDTYALNGAIYLVKRSVLLSGRSWCPPNAHAYVMPPERSLDVDSPWDLKLIRMVFDEMNKNSGQNDQETALENQFMFQDYEFCLNNGGHDEFLP